MKKKILFIEDELNEIEDYIEVLELDDFIVEAHDFNIVENKIKITDYDLIVLDIVNLKSNKKKLIAEEIIRQGIDIAMKIDKLKVPYIFFSILRLPEGIIPWNLTGKRRRFISCPDRTNLIM